MVTNCAVLAVPAQMTLVHALTLYCSLSFIIINVVMKQMYLIIQQHVKTLASTVLLINIIITIRKHSTLTIKFVRSTGKEKVVKVIAAKRIIKVIIVSILVIVLVVTKVIYNIKTVNVTLLTIVATI